MITEQNPVMKNDDKIEKGILNTRKNAGVHTDMLALPGY